MRTPPAATVGTRPAPRTIGPVSQTDIVRFAGAGGDFNPLHHDPAYALAAGFDRPIAMGQMTAGLLAAWLTDWCGVENLRSYSVRFRSPLAIGDTLELSGEVVSVRRVDAGTFVAELELRGTCADTVVVTGSATVSVRAAE
ncbi:dihydroxy-acid dehydratase [soil metagenome]